MLASKWPARIRFISNLILGAALAFLPVAIWLNKQLDGIEVIVKRNKQLAAEHEAAASEWRAIAVWSLETQSPPDAAARHSLADYIDSLLQSGLTESERERLLQTSRKLRNGN